MEDGIRAAKDETVAALRRQIQGRLQTVRSEIQTLTAQAAKINESESERARVLERRQKIANLQKEFAGRIQALTSPVQKRPAEPAERPAVSDAA